VVNFLQTEKSGKNLVRGEEQGGQNVNFDPTVDEEKLITESRCRFNFSEDGWKKRLDEVRKELGF
jgi:hypothetical protein